MERRKKQNNPRNQILREQLRHEDLFGYIAQRKRERFVYMKNWEDRRVLRSKIIMGIAEKFNSKLMSRAKESQQNFQQIMGYMKDRINQDTKYGNAPRIDLSSAYTKSQHRSLFYNRLNEKLKQVYDQEAAMQAKYTEFAATLENRIVQELMITHSNKFQQAFDQFCNSSQELSQNFKREHTLSLQKYQEYTIVFTETGRIYMKHNEHQQVKDLFQYEYQYVLHAHKSFELLKEYFIHQVEFYQQLTELEKARVITIRDIFDQFVIIQSQFCKPFDEEEHKRMVQKISTIGDVKEIADLFNLESLIDNDELKYLYYSSADKEMNYETLLNLVRELELNNIRTPSIAIKDIDCLYQIHPNGEFKEAKLILTLDQNWLIYLMEPKSKLYILVQVIPLKSSHLQINKEKSELQIVENKKQIVGISRQAFLFQVDMDSVLVQELLSQVLK